MQEGKTLIAYKSGAQSRTGLLVKIWSGKVLSLRDKESGRLVVVRPVNDLPGAVYREIRDGQML